MNQRGAETIAGPFEPARPTLWAAGFCTLVVAVLAIPMLAGKWLASPVSDQYPAGYAFRYWGAEWWKRTGHVPLWNPEMFGGLPFVGAGHGDIFYATSFLRLILPVETVVNLGFVVHAILAGLFTYLLLRRLRVSWTGSVVGGLAYQLSGLIASYPSPGHDGKLFASTALPLACLGLVMALREKRGEGYAVLAGAVALALLGHFQIAYYLLIAAGLFALYLTHDAVDTMSARGYRVVRLGLALAAVGLGIGVAMVQLLPFLQHIPFSPRAEGYRGFEGSTSYAIPWNHLPEFFLKSFVGARETYWGSNPIKLHSEYLGLPVVALAALGVGAGQRRRLVLWLGGIGLLFLLISLGAETPFYKIWWTVMPIVKKTRAPGMAFFVVAFVVALLAGLGTERLERKEARRALVPWLVGAGVLALLAVTGAFGSLAESLARSADAATGRAPGAAVRANLPALTWGALSSALALGAAAVLALAAVRNRITPRLFALGLALVISGDLWLNARPFWVYAPNPRTGLFRADPLTDRIRTTPLPYRVLDLGVYPTEGVSLMAFDIPQVLGHHAFEMRYYDDLLGGRNQWTNLLRHLQLWDLLAVRYVLAPEGIDSIPGYRRILSAAQTSAGVPAHLFERVAPAPYARVVPAALKVDSHAVIPTLMDPRLPDFDRLVLVTPDQPVDPPPFGEMPAPSPSRASVIAWQPGRMTITLDPAPGAGSYLLVAENWYPHWRAVVDGAPAPVLRGNQSLITVALPGGARQVELTFRSRDFELGRLISLMSLVALVGIGVAPAVARRRRRG